MRWWKSECSRLFLWTCSLFYRSQLMDSTPLFIMNICSANFQLLTPVLHISTVHGNISIKSYLVKNLELRHSFQHATISGVFSWKKCTFYSQHLDIQHSTAKFVKKFPSNVRTSVILFSVVFEVVDIFCYSALLYERSITKFSEIYKFPLEALMYCLRINQATYDN